MSEITAGARPKELVIEFQVFRACGQCRAANPTGERSCPACGAASVIEPLRIAYWHRNPLRRLWWKLTHPGRG